jgi:molybdate transport system substrate-binding protein
VRAPLLRFLALVVALAPAVGLAAGAAEGEDPATVYAAASLTEVFPRIASDPRFQFAGSNQLAVQIRQGAPADVFASASPVYTQALYKEGLVERPRVFATNTLVLAVPRSNPAKLTSIADLRKRPKLRLVVAGPKVPIGLYTRQVLQRLALLRVLRTTVSQETDVKGIVGKLALGEADAGFVYRTDVEAASGRLTAIPIPKRGRPSVRYELAVVSRTKHAEAAWSFVADVLGASGRRELARAGFGLPRP